MEMKKINFGVIGAGSWGTALSILLAKKGYKVFLWSRNEEQVIYMLKFRKNPKHLKEYKFPKNIIPTNKLEEILNECKFIINAIPTQSIRNFYEKKKDSFKDKIIINASKGIEIKSLKLIDEIFYDIFKNKDNFAYLSGPSFAEEVAQFKPTAVTISSYNTELAKKCQQYFNTSSFRVYYETDVKGVLLGGAMKNVIAIAAGIIEGLNLGLNSIAALVTRGLTEIRRIGDKLGANSLTFSGLSGLGDLVLTCYGNLSRNRKVGINIGKGRKLKEILTELGEVAEGVYTCVSAYNLGKKLNVDTPITNEVYKILYEGKSPLIALQDLMSRTLKHEKD